MAIPCPTKLQLRVPYAELFRSEFLQPFKNFDISHRVFVGYASFERLGEHGSGLKSRGSIQDFKQLRQHCLNEGYLFEDPDFPANNSSLFVNSLPRYKYEWKRPSEFCKNPCLFVEGFSRFDLVQGQIGDCWLVAAAANLTLNKQLFHRVVPVDQSFVDNYAGIFHFRFWHYGRWVDVVIDDRLPTYKGELVYLHSSQKNEFWSPLLEKAYAKLYGSYEALVGGATSEGMEDLTGGICEIFDIRTAPPKLFEIMLKAFQRSSMMGCSIRSTKHSEQCTEEGLVKGHAYSITKVCNILCPQKTSLIRLRNPWGNDKEWNGPWSDKSKEWRSIEESLKEKLGLIFENDGEFWMSFDDFSFYFSTLEICNLDPILLNKEFNPIITGKRWETYQFEGSWVQGVTAGGCLNHPETFHLNPQYVVTLENADDGAEEDNCTIIIGLMQKTNRIQRIMGNNPLSIGFDIYRLHDPEKLPKPLNSRFFKYNAPAVSTTGFEYNREVTERFVLPKGTYCIIPATYFPNENGAFIIRVFSEKRSNMMEHDVEIDSSEIDLRINKIEWDQSRYIQSTNIFKEIPEEDIEVDWTTLKKILDETIGSYSEEGFSCDVCRSLIAMMDFDRSGKLGFEEYYWLWKRINNWKDVFTHYDKDNSGYLDVSELRQALKSAGYQLNQRILCLLAHRYAGKNGEISFDDFIMCAVRLKGMIGMATDKELIEMQGKISSKRISRGTRKKLMGEMWQNSALQNGLRLPCIHEFTIVPCSQSASDEHGEIEGENEEHLNKTEAASRPQPRKYERKEIYCPFTWNECRDNLKANSLMMKLDEKLSPEEDSQWRRFCYHILLMCMHIKRKEEEKAIAVLDSSSEILLNSRNENFFKEIIPGFEHVLFSCELFMYVEKGDNEKARSIFSRIKSFHVLNQVCQAATLAVKASVLLLFGTKAQQEALRCINEAIELDPDEFGIRKGAWYCLAAKIHAEIRNTQGYNMMPSFEERQLAERSVLKNPFPIHYVYLADTYRQIAKMLLQQSFKDNKEDAEGMSKKAKKMYEDAINDENASMRSLTRSGMGLIKLPKYLRNVELARIAFDRVLKMDPDHKSALIGMGNLLNWCLNDYKEALKYFEKACINHPVGRSVIQMKCMIDENYNPVEDCDKFIEREKEMNLGREQLTVFYEVVKAEYFLVKRKNIMEAARYWEKAVTSGPSAKEVWEYQCLFATNKRSKFSRMMVDEINLALKQRMEREDVEYLRKILKLSNSSSQESTEAERK